MLGQTYAKVASYNVSWKGYSPQDFLDGLDQNAKRESQCSTVIFDLKSSWMDHKEHLTPVSSRPLRERLNYPH